MTSFFLFQCFSDKPDRRFNSRGLNLLLNVKNKRSINCVDSSLPIYQASTFHNLLGLERQDNIPFPSCFLPPCQNESSCETMHLKMCIPYKLIKLIFIWSVCTKTRFKSGAQDKLETAYWSHSNTDRLKHHTPFRVLKILWRYLQTVSWDRSEAWQFSVR